jgi:hypothetical protein
MNRLDKAFLDVVRGAVDEENRSRSTRQGKIVVKLIGDQLSGETPLSSFLSAHSNRRGARLG